MNNNREQALLKEAIELIRYLDRYLWLKGQKLTSYNADSTTALGLQGTFDDEIPASLQVHPPISLREILEEQREESGEKALLHDRIIAACNDKNLYSFTWRLLAEKYAVLKGVDITTVDFRKISLANLLKLLRAAEKKAQEAEIKTFTLCAVREISQSGVVQRVQTFWPSFHASWKHVENILTTNSAWQAQQLGYHTGLTLLDGKWMYMTTLRGKEDTIVKLDRTLHDLESKEQYFDMRRRMERDEDFGVLVWHEKMLEYFQEAKAAHEAKLKKDIEDFGPAPPASPRDVDPYDFSELT